MNGSKDITVTIASAVVGGVVGYLMFTDAGQTMRRQMAPAVRDVSRELTNLHKTVRRAAQAARQGWTLVNDALGSDDGAEGLVGRSSARFEGRPYVR